MPVSAPGTKSVARKDISKPVPSTASSAAISAPCSAPRNWSCRTVSHAIRAQASGLPGALSKVGLDIFVDPRNEGPGINQLSIDDSLVSVVEVEGEEFLYYKLPKLTVALIKGTSADRKGNITFDDQYMSGDALSICQAVKANNGKVIVQVDRLSDVPSRPRNAVIPGCLVDALVVVEPEERPDAYVALTGSFEIPYKEWSEWNDKIVASSSQTKNNNPARIIGRRAVKKRCPGMRERPASSTRSP